MNGWRALDTIVKCSFFLTFEEKTASSCVYTLQSTLVGYRHIYGGFAHLSPQKWSLVMPWKDHSHHVPFINVLPLFHPAPMKAALVITRRSKSTVSTLLDYIWLFTGISQRELYIFSGILFSLSSYNKELVQISTNILCRSGVMWFCIKFTVLNSESQVHVFFFFFTPSESVRFILLPSHRLYLSSRSFVPEMFTTGRC